MAVDTAQGVISHVQADFADAKSITRTVYDEQYLKLTPRSIAGRAGK